MQEPNPEDRAGLHVALIMDGNGRWAGARGRPRSEGHRAGLGAVRRAVEAAPGLGVDLLTLYAFSSDNWRRPREEVDALMRLFETRIWTEARRLAGHGVRLSVIGRRDRLAPSLRRAIEQAEALTFGGQRLHLRIAVDYSARETLLRAARLAGRLDGLDRAAFARSLALACHADAPAPDVDLLVRTGGERRLSDFLLWECAYAELYFSDVLWPDFQAEHLAEAVRWFHGRQRRFGGLPVQSAA